MISEIKLTDITPYAFNNKAHSEGQIKAIAESIKQFGYNVPIVVDEDNVILAGHGRYFALQLLEKDSVKVVKREGLTEEQKKAYRLVDNKLNQGSQWDFDNVMRDLVELDLDEFESFDLLGLLPKDLQQEVLSTIGDAEAIGEVEGQQRSDLDSYAEEEYIYSQIKVKCSVAQELEVRQLIRDAVGMLEGVEIN